MVTRLIDKRMSRARGSKPISYRSEPEGNKKSEDLEGVELHAIEESTIGIQYSRGQETELIVTEGNS